jgi:hypothetical protein
VVVDSAVVVGGGAVDADVVGGGEVVGGDVVGVTVVETCSVVDECVVGVVICRVVGVGMVVAGEWVPLDPLLETISPMTTPTMMRTATTPIMIHLALLFFSGR